MRRVNIERGRLLSLTGSLLDAEALLWPEFLRDPDAPDSYWALWELYSRIPVLATIAASELKWQTRAVAAGHPGYSALFSLADGILTSIAFAPPAQEFAELRFDLAAVADPGAVFVLDRICGWPNRSTLLCAGAFSGSDPPTPLPGVESEFLMPASRGLGLGYVMKEPWSYRGSPFQLGGRGERPLVSSGMVAATSADSGVQLHAQLSHPDPGEPQLAIAPGEPIPVGRGPVHWAGRFENSPDVIRTSPREWLGHVSLYDTQIGDIRWTTAATFELLHSGAVIESGV